MLQELDHGGLKTCEHSLNVFYGWLPHHPTFRDGLSHRSQGEYLGRKKKGEKSESFIQLAPRAKSGLYPHLASEDLEVEKQTQRSLGLERIMDGI